MKRMSQNTVARQILGIAAAPKPAVKEEPHVVIRGVPFYFRVDPVKAREQRARDIEKSGLTAEEYEWAEEELRKPENQPDEPEPNPKGERCEGRR